MTLPAAPGVRRRGRPRSALIEPAGWSDLRREAGSLRGLLRMAALYAALRVWTLVINCFPVELNLQSARLLGRIWWFISPRHRERALAHLRPALGDGCGEAQLRRIARRSFEHWAQVYLVEFAMTPRIVNEWSWARFVELGTLGPALRELLAQRPTLMLTAHFGNFELLGYAIARLGLPLHAVMRPLDNPLINTFLVAARESGGLSLLFKRGAAAMFDDILGRGGTLCFIADQDAGRKGAFAEFFGRRASWYKSIALLAMQHAAPIIVGAAVRTRPGFHYRIDTERIIHPDEWAGRDDPLAWITQTYAAALEAAIRRHPEQYLWIHRRWKSRPKDERDPTALPGAPSPTEHALP